MGSHNKRAIMINSFTFISDENKKGEEETFSFFRSSVYGSIGYIHSTIASTMVHSQLVKIG